MVRVGGRGTIPVHAKLQYHGIPLNAPLSQTSGGSTIPFPQTDHHDDVTVIGVVLDPPSMTLI